MKPLIALFACLALLAPTASVFAARAEVFSVPCAPADGDACALLVRDDGTPLTPMNAYQSIYVITPQGTPEAERLYSAVPMSYADAPVPDAASGADLEFYYRVALLGADGRRLTGFDYVGLRCEAPDRVVFTLPDETCGVMDASGRVLMPAQYADMRYTGRGWLVLDPGGRAGDGGAASVAFIDADGVRHDTGLHVRGGGLAPYAEGACAVSDVEEYGGGGVFVDDRGEVLFDRAFDLAHGFEDGTAIVGVDGLQGLIDRSGKFVQPPEFEYISRESTLNGPVCIGCIGGRVSVFDGASGALLFERRFDAGDASALVLNAGMIRLIAGEESFIYAPDGTLLMALAPEDDIEGWFNEPCTDAPERLIRSYGEWPFSASHLIDLDGNRVGGEFQGMSGVTWRDGRGFYLTSHYRVYRDADGDLVPDWRSWRYGLCDQDGNMLLDGVYRSLEMLSPDRFWVADGSRTGMIDLDGNWYYAISDYTKLVD